MPGATSCARESLVSRRTLGSENDLKVTPQCSIKMTLGSFILAVADAEARPETKE